MHLVTRTRLGVVALLLAVGLAACGSVSEPSIPASGKLVGQSATSPGRIVLSVLGAQRIGVQTAVAKRVRTATSAARVVIPYSAVVYDPSGKTYAFANTAPLTYVEVPITVDHIGGNQAFLARGPKAGAKVVSVGAEELYGVQTGVLAQT
jgi:hypothetical protein